MSKIKQAIIENGQIVGWRDYIPPSAEMTAEEWKNSPAGKAAYQALLDRLSRNGDDSDLDIRVAKSKKGWYWKYTIL